MVQDARAANDETLLSEDDDRVFYRLPVWKRVVIMLGGPVMNLLFAIVLFAILLSGIGVQTATTTVAARQRVRDPRRRRPHRVRGIRPGRARRSGGHRSRATSSSRSTAPASTTFAEASAIIRESPGDQLDRRRRARRRRAQRDADADGDRPARDRRARQAGLDDDGTPQTEEVGFVGIRPEVDYVRQPIWAGPQAAIENVGAVAGIIWQLPVKVWETGVSLVTGEERDPNGPLSVVGRGHPRRRGRRGRRADPQPRRGNARSLSRR